MSVVQELSRQKRAETGAKPKPKARDGKAALLFLGPWILGFVLITLGPMLASLYLAFTDYNLLSPPEWSGLDNFQAMLDDSRLLNSLRVTFIYVFVGVPISLAVALAVAVLLDRGMRGLAFYRSVFYLPSLLGASVAIAVLWRQMFGYSGLVNQLLEMLGIQGIGWISDPRTALGALILLNVWTFGAPLVIFLAGLRQIPQMYYESAELDGCGKLAQFFRITMPLLTPIIFFNLVLGIISSFQAFTQAYVVSDGRGGPADSTMFFTLYLYQEGFAEFNMGYAAAMAWLLLVIIAVFTLVNFVAAKYWVHYDDN